MNTALAALETALSTKVSNLSSDERRKYGSISEQNKLFVNKVNDHAMGQASLDDYAYTSYKTGTSAPGYELKQFFSRTRKADENETTDKE